MADFGAGRVTRIANGIISTLARGGSLLETHNGRDGGPAASTYLSKPLGVAVDPAGDVCISEGDGGHRVGEVLATATVSVAQALPPPSNQVHQPTGVPDPRQAARGCHLRVGDCRGQRATCAGLRLHLTLAQGDQARIDVSEPQALQAFILRGRARRTYVVRVTATTTTGQVLTATRRYHTCSRTLGGTVPRL